jgi:cephalosporin-C deacetylase-like acetyl esterase
MAAAAAQEALTALAVVFCTGCGTSGPAASGSFAAADATGPDAAFDVGLATDARPADVGASADSAANATPLPDAASTADTPVDSIDDPDSVTVPADVAGAALAAADADIPAPPAVVWDLALIADSAAANCQFTNAHTVFKDGQLIQVWALAYTGYEVEAGELKPIPIHAFAARPPGNGVLPGVVQGHGLGGHAEEKDAVALAARLGVFVVAYTGPGGGTAPDNTSGGKSAGAADGAKMFDTLQDVRGSWFWGHATAMQRGLTCLTTRPDVAKDKLGVTGFSAGAVASLLVAGVDPRVKAAVPLSGTLAWEVATQAPKAWQHTLLQKAGLTIASPAWQKLMTGLIQPTPALLQAKAKILMVNGTTDEFFPLTAYVATFSAIPSGDARTSLAANFDHGCYKLTGGESAKTIEDRATIRAEGGQKMWFSHWFQMAAKYAYLPQPPQVQVQPAGGAMLITAVVDPGGSALQVEEAKAWGSNDDCYFFAGATLDCKGGICSKLVPVPQLANTVVFVDVQYKTKDLLPERFSISSLPALPGGLVPKVRDIATCL